MEYFDVYDSNGKNTKAIVPRDNCQEILKKINGYHIVILGLIVVNHNVLIDQRALSKDYGGYWEIPGGGLKAGETSKQGMVRELYEELGLCIDINQLTLAKSFTDDNWRIIYHIYLIQLNDLAMDQLTIQKDELKCVALVSKEEFKQMMVTDYVLRFDQVMDLVDKI